VPSRDEAVVALQESIERLYEVFARYPLKEGVHACSHCYPESYAALAALLYAKPLRELSAEELGQYAFEALSTWGDESDWRHFLPRILELHCETREIGDFQLAMEKLGRARWRIWQTDEQTAVHDYLTALWWYLLLAPYYEQDLHWKEIIWILVTRLEGIAIALGDLSPFLQMWRDAKDPQALMLLAWFVLRFQQDLLRGRIEPQAYWIDEHTRQQVLDWLREPETQQMLIQAAALGEDPESVEQATAILHVIPDG
jgi:hypothetical protein